MTRMGDEMILALAATLGDLNKTAAKKDDKECKKCECDPCECDKDDDDKDEKKDKKKESALYIVQGLAKLASELDEMGADEASSLVDDALRVVVQNIKDRASE